MVAQYICERALWFCIEQAGTEQGANCVMYSQPGAIHVTFTHTEWCESRHKVKN